MKRIQLISGPRNLSTALMYSFGNREDTTILDEPMYAHYLSKNNIIHPGQEMILKSQSTAIEKVKAEILFKNYSTNYLFIKNMAHHFINIDWNFILKMENIIYIRHPKQLIASFAKVIDQPTLLDIGVELSFQLYEFLVSNNQTPIILDSGELLKNPEKILRLICDQLEIPFTKKMLNWEAGPRKEDGVWAEHWYTNVHQSTGFKKQKSSNQPMADRLIPLYETAMEFYQPLFENSIKA